MKIKNNRYFLVFISVVFLCGGLFGNLLFAFGPYGVTAEFKSVKPGVYDDTEKKVIDEIKNVLSGSKEQLAEKIKAQTGGKKFYVGTELQSHQVEFNSAWTPIAYYTPGTNDLASAAKDLTPRNKLYLDPEYAAKSKYGGLIAAPFAVDIAVGLPYTPKLSDAYVWVSNEGAESFGGLDHEVTFHKPIYATDTLTSFVTRQDMVDVTPAEGSEYRAFRVIGEGEMYNAKGEKVMSISHTAIEMFRVFKNSSDCEKFEGKVPTNATVRLLKDWSSVRPVHVYTDEDWETIKGIWRKEFIRGADTLYWEDVRIGDEPAWTCDGPTVEMTRPGGGSVPGMSTITVRDVLMDTISTDNSPMAPLMMSKSELAKDANGIYQIRAEELPGGGMPPISAGAKHPNQRLVFMNTEGRKYAVRMVTNWMGDNGFLHKMAWRVVNDTDHNKFPATFDRPSYLLKVPYLKAQGKFASTHGYAGDVGITKAYVCDKYVKDGKYYVDLVVWSETIEGYIWSECYAVVELPSRGSR